MTYRDRRIARAARLRGWADKRDAKAIAESDTAHDMGDRIPLGQPIIGRWDRNYRDRIGGHMDKAVEHGRTADRMNEKAANIESAVDAAIYDDDPDACEALGVRIAGMEAERARVKAYNASCRKGQRDLGLLTDSELALVVRLAGIPGGGLKDDGSFPSYHLSNLSGRLAKDRQRLARLFQAAAEYPFHDHPTDTKGT